MLTDIAVETKEFLGMHGHGGIISSARHLHAEISAPFADLVRMFKPRRIVLTGHSLGAAATTALTMLWRAGEKGGVSERDLSVLRDVECVAFCPLPIVSDPQVATNAKGIFPAFERVVSRPIVFTSSPVRDLCFWCDGCANEHVERGRRSCRAGNASGG